MEQSNDQLKKINTRPYRLLTGLMVVVFLCYNLAVYTNSANTSLPPMNEQEIAGEVLWQGNNCTACHQLYGLGGYLGPDLTNVISTQGKGPMYVKAFLNSGIKAMPRFDFTEIEKEEIVAFLSYVDKTGYFPNKDAQLQNTGWVELKYKTADGVENE